MRTRTRFDCSRTAQRGGFTLIELMVVITIIAALMALTAGAVMKVMATSQTNNTQTRLDSVQSQLSRAWSKVKDEAYYKSQMNEPVPGLGTPVSQWILTNLAQIGPSDPNAQERVRVIYVKLRLRQAFPMSFNEALNPFPLPPLPGYATYLTSLGIVGTTPATASIESSACLLMALQRGASGAGINPEQIAGGGAIGNLNGITYLTDAWGRPIFFSRFPAGSTYLNPAVNPATLAANTANTITTPWWPLGPVTCYSQTGNNDPGDPQGYLQAPSWGTSPMGASFAALTLQVLAAGNTSYKLAPMVASGGPNDWVRAGGVTPFDPITFYTLPTSGALFSTP